MIAKESNIVTETEKPDKGGAVKKSSAKKKASNQPNVISRYFRETRGELRKVTWPTREESWRLTLIVLGVSLAFSIFLWVFDTLFSSSLRFLLERILI
jgi:preprotein translocase subunit SecE